MLPSVLCNIIINYLADPPKLPFMDDLLDVTLNIKLDLEQCIYSPTFYTLSNGYIQQGKFRIYNWKSPYNRKIWYI